MKKIIKLKLGVSLLTITFSIIGGINQAVAQTCTTPPSCAALGYDKSASDCTGQPSLKCPFDQSQMFCIAAAISGNCAIGDILYSDKSCSANVVAGKTAIGIVFDATYSLAIALETDIKHWSMEAFDVQGIYYPITSSFDALLDWRGKSNTATVMSYCKANGKSCPAFKYVDGYMTSGTRAGDWYLPAMGELNAIYVNKSLLNGSLSKVGGIALPDKYHWSSSEYSANGAWFQRFSDGIFGFTNRNQTEHSVRPVLAF